MTPSSFTLIVSLATSQEGDLPADLIVRSIRLLVVLEEFQCLSIVSGIFPEHCLIIGKFSRGSLVISDYRLSLLNRRERPVVILRLDLIGRHSTVNLSL